MKKNLTYSQFVIRITICIGLLMTSCNSEIIEGQDNKATFYGLGFLPSNPPSTSVANGVSPDGFAVVGYSSTFERGNFEEGFIWTRQDLTMRALYSILNNSDIDTGCEAIAVSNGGGIVVGVSFLGNTSTAVRWQGAGNGSFLGINGAPNSGANGISADGSVIVGWVGEKNISGDMAICWSSDEATIQHNKGRINDISNDGFVIVGVTQVGNHRAGFFRADSSRFGHNISGVIGAEANGEAQANAVSADGSVVVGWIAPGLTRSGKEAFAFSWEKTNGIWENSATIGLGGLPETEESEAHDVSANGSIIVGYSLDYDSQDGPHQGTAFVWTEAGGMENLKSVLEHNYGLDLSGWKLSSANGISDDGTVIVGEGCNTNRDTSGGSTCHFDGKGGFREAWAVYLDWPLESVTGNNHPPLVSISSPSSDETFPQGTPIVFSGSAMDDEDGALTGGVLVWTSNIDGKIGTGREFTRSDLSAGTHTVTLTATDSEGTTGITEVTVEIESSSAAGCENFNLHLDYNPVEVAAGGSDAVAVFIDRADDFTGQVELKLYSVDGGPSWSDIMTTWAFEPQLATGDASASTLSFTIRKDVPQGDYQFGIAGGSPLLEVSDPPCTVSLTFQVVQ